MKKKLYFGVVSLILLLPLISAFPFRREDNCEKIIVLDTDNKNPLPEHFRNIEFLNISGSGQFRPDQLANLKKAINKPNITIVDLRQESHGFVNDYPISFYSPYKTLNDGLTTEEVTKVENKELSTIKVGSELNILNKLCKVVVTTKVDSVSNEADLVTKENFQYKRFAVRDGGVPTPTVVDNFITFIKNNPSDMHLHFHCDWGEGRTTTFMIMYQSMKNTNNASLQEIQSFQTGLGNITFKYDKNRQDFINSFYQYTQDNISNNFETSYSQWIKNNSNS